ncbi:MAG: radical SAM protein [Acidobacteriota bacterium]
MKRRYPQIETFIFDDDLFTLDERYCCDFAKAYTDARIGVPFVLNAHVQAFTAPVARALSESPCKMVKLGVESGNHELRKMALGRHMTNQQIVAAFDLCHRYGLHTSAFVMFGLPHETRQMMEETVGLIARIRPGRMRWSIFFPFPGTASYEICERAGLIDQERMQSMTNYFCASCLKLDQETDLFVRKLQRTFHWWVNARAGFPLSREYAGLTEELDSLDLPTWQRVSEEIHCHDRETSDAYLSKVVPADPVSLARYRHYSLRYTEAMAVSSDFILSEKGDFKSRPVRRWNAFREQNPTGTLPGM